jgi:hypothetical protein
MGGEPACRPGLVHASSPPVPMHVTRGLTCGRDLDDLETATCAWGSWFNTERLHSELGDQTPTEIEDRYRQESQPTAA